MKSYSFARIVVFVLVCFSFSAVYCQKYDAVDKAVKAYPRSFSNAKQLATRINSQFKTDEDKVRAAFSWIAMNIGYDVKLSIAQANDQQIAFYYTSEEERALKLIKFQRDLTEKTIKSGKGVCQGYAALFHTVCDLMGIKCLDVAGTSKSSPGNIGLLPKASDHVWNVVKIGDTWKFIDVTWAAGAVDGRTNRFVWDFNDAYFFTSPEVFFLNHFPDDTAYLLTLKTEQDFAQLPLFYGPYLNAGYAIVSPESGIFSNTKLNAIPFKIVDLPLEDRVSYVFSDENKGRDAVLRRSGNLSEFDVPMTDRSRGYLTVYVNGASVASYKIQR